MGLTEEGRPLSVCYTVQLTILLRVATSGFGATRLTGYARVGRAGQEDESGWFYGSNVPWSSADVFVVKSMTDPLSVVAAENFNYTTGALPAEVGDTVFFRGRNGFFGAWSIENIEGGGGGNLSGTWYFIAGGGGDFTRAVEAGDTPIQQGSCTNI